MVGFGLYGSIHGPTDYQVNIQVGARGGGAAGGGAGPTPDPRPSTPPPPQIIHTDSNTVLGQNDTGFSCDGSAGTFRVMFKEPVEVLPSVNYTACATLKVGAPTLPADPHCPLPPTVHPNPAR